jgi:hypothetical protein
MQPLLYHVDRTEAFRLPPGLTHAEIMAKLGANATMVAVYVSE